MNYISFPKENGMGKRENGTVVDGEGGNDTLTISGMPPRKETAPKGIHNFLSGGKLLQLHFAFSEKKIVF